MQLSRRAKVWLGVLALASALTSPLAVAKLVALFSKIPYYAIRSLLGFFFPSLFMKSVKNETVLITGAASIAGVIFAAGERLRALPSSLSPPSRLDAITRVMQAD